MLNHFHQRGGLTSTRSSCKDDFPYIFHLEKSIDAAKIYKKNETTYIF